MNFQVELTSHCDLTCGYCPNRDMERERAYMSDDVFDAILYNYVVPYKDMNSHSPPTFIGHKDGEPLLNKHLPQRLRAVSDALPDMKIDVYSHGLMLPKWRARGADFVEFLASLPNRSRYLMSYHPRNHDGSVNDYGPVIQYMKEVLRDPPKNVEFIMVSHLASHNTRDVQAEWQALWRDEVQRGVLTVHSNVAINQWTGRIDEPGCVEFHGCPYGDFGHMFFGATGNVIACCLDLEEEIVFGNVLRDAPLEMVVKLDAFYADQRAKKVDHAVCHNCHGLPPALQQLGVRA